MLGVCSVLDLDLLEAICAEQTVVRASGVVPWFLCVSNLLVSQAGLNIRLGVAVHMLRSLKRCEGLWQKSVVVLSKTLLSE